MQDGPVSAWISTFIQNNGRAPRILQLGNICNNAYQIAKILNARGADCDVLSIDYYHIIGAPEWEDADFTGAYGSQFFPAWHRVDLHGFVRPRWFAAGPRDAAIAYLLARRRGQSQKAERLWRTLERKRRRLAQREGRRSLWDKLAETAHMFATYFAKSPRLLDLKMHHRLGQLNAAGQQKMRELEGSAPIIQRAKADFAQAFPGQGQPFGPYLDEAAANALAYRELFAEYDLVQAYSADPIWPYLAGAPHYVAYENGTLRDLPAATGEYASLLMLAYAKAGAVMITNTDCVESAQCIAKNTAVPLVYSLHGVDTQRMLHAAQAARQTSAFDARFGVPADVPLFFCPARHTWDEGRSAYLKGEDKALRAAARLAEEGHNFRLLMVNIGDETPQIKTMVAETPALCARVQWIDPIGKRELQQVFWQAQAVLDQFTLRVFGAITFEVLCAGAPLVSQAVSSDVMDSFFGAPLPYFACETEDDIYTALLRVLKHPSDAKALGAQGPGWMQAHHSAENIVSRCLQAYYSATEQ